MKEIKGHAQVGSDGYLTDSLIITKSIYSYALLAFIVLAIVSVVWGVYGNIPHKIQGMGEINSQLGLSKVVANYPGQIDQVNIAVNDQVKVGQVLFVLKQPEMLIQIRDLEMQIDLLRQKNALVKSGNKTSLSLQGGKDDLEVERIKAQLAECGKSILFLQDKIAKEERLHSDGLITYAQLFSTKTALQQKTVEKIGLEEDLSVVSLTAQEFRLNRDIGENEMSIEIEKLERELEDLQTEYDMQTKVTASEDGYVTQLQVRYGDVVTLGQSLVLLEGRSKEAEFVVNLYIPYNSNAQIREGMEVDVEPFVVDRNLYGWLKGKVVETDQFVASLASLDEDLDNKELINLLTSYGPVFRTKVQLQKDAGTISGLAWSNKKGPPFKITSGALARSYVKVKNKAPLDYLIPIFKEYFE